MYFFQRLAIFINPLFAMTTFPNEHKLIQSKTMMPWLQHNFYTDVFVVIDYLKSR